MMNIPITARIVGKPKLEWAYNITYKKETNIFNKICPATKFANKRIARLKTREKNEIASIRISPGMINKGMPPDKKRLKSSALWYKIPQIKFTIKNIIEK